MPATLYVMCEGKRKDGTEWQEVGNMGRLDAQRRYFNCQEVKKPSSSEVISEYVLAWFKERQKQNVLNGSGKNQQGQKLFFAWSQVSRAGFCDAATASLRRNSDKFV